MAQTRAGAKALRNALAWVVVLAGYRPTPAEELPGSGVDDKPDPTGGAVPFAYEETTPPRGNGTLGCGGALPEGGPCPAVFRASEPVCARSRSG